MLFNSFHFLVFFPVVVLCYWLFPKRIKMYWLLAASYYFYMCWNAKYALLMLFSTAATFICGRLIHYANTALTDPHKTRFKKASVVVCLILNLGILFFFKYFGFFTQNINRLFEFAGVSFNIPAFDVLLPVGISFYTFQALGYSIDVYRGTIPAEKNFFQYALFVSFFPQLVAGPIERSGNLLGQLAKPKPFNYENMKNGLLMMGWGLFEKMVIADRLAQLVNTVYGDYQNQSGAALVIATVFFAVQIYCDFAGYSDIAIGAAQVMGIRLMQNFKRPYFSKSIAEFWRRWHISLSSWFKDYLYFPLGGSRVGKLKTYRNIMIVFLVSGLWHGASWSFIVWGAIHGVYQIIGNIVRPVSDKLIKNRQNFFVRAFSVIKTFILVDFAWIFFRAGSMTVAVGVIRSIFTNFAPYSLLNGGVFELGLKASDFALAILSIAVLFTVSLIRRRHSIRAFIARRNIVIRWAIYFAIIFIILIFGVYGPGYSAAQFIYFQF